MDWRKFNYYESLRRRVSDIEFDLLALNLGEKDREKLEAEREQYLEELYQVRVGDDNED